MIKDWYKSLPPIWRSFIITIGVLAALIAIVAAFIFFGHWLFPVVLAAVVFMFMWISVYGIITDDCDYGP